MDKLFIHGLDLPVLIGVYLHERTKKQSILLDLDLSLDRRKVGCLDVLYTTLDYDCLIEYLALCVEDTAFLLIETLAEHIAEGLLKTFNIQWLRLCLTKPKATSAAKKVGIIIERTAA